MFIYFINSCYLQTFTCSRRILFTWSRRVQRIIGFFYLTHKSMSLEKLITWLIAVVDFFLWNGAGTPVWMYVDFFRLFAYLFFFLLLFLLLSFLLAKYTGYHSFSSNLGRLESGYSAPCRGSQRCRQCQHGRWSYDVCEWRFFTGFFRVVL